MSFFLFRMMSFLIGLLVISGNQLHAVSEDEQNESIATAKKWLQLIDTNRFEDSWQEAAPNLQIAMPKEDWVHYLHDVRLPLGRLQSREVLEQIPAENPKGLPRGEYMVIVFNTAFSNRPKSQELVTLAQGNDGKWHVLTYHVSGNQIVSPVPSEKP